MQIVGFVIAVLLQRVRLVGAVLLQGVGFIGSVLLQLLCILVRVGMILRKLSSVVLLDDQGKDLHRFQQFNFYNTSFNAMGAYLQVNPSTKMAFTVSPGAGQIVPFSYAGS